MSYIVDDVITLKLQGEPQGDKKSPFTESLCKYKVVKNIKTNVAIALT